ncbi:MAG: hypothetical protein IKQ04_05500 [Oscillospiraceae bacterium]|nr:hypothetical protein [Oscillospiraceae bacterium]
MKKTVHRLLTALLLCLLLSTTVFADMGPHFSVEIRIDGLEGRRCYATLLSRQESTGPASAWDGHSAPYGYLLDGMDREEGLEAFYALGRYQDPDGYYFLKEFFLVEDGSFTWGYFPPDDFKLLLYFPDTGTLTAGEKLERYAFDSAYRCQLQPDGSLGSFTRTNGLTRQIPSFLLRAAATILIELLIAGLFGLVSKASVPLLIKTNLWTQLALNLVLALYSHSFGASGGMFTAVYVILELTVLAVETAVYVGGLPQRTKRNSKKLCAVYALAANAASLALGLWLARLLPFKF